MSPQPIPKYIERLALKIAQEEAERARQANTRDGARAIARRVEAEAEAAGFGSAKEYVEALTNDSKGVTPPEGTSPTSAFWSHGVEHPDAPPNWKGEHFLDNRYIAEAWARTQNARHAGSAQTLETTEAGRRLNAMYLFEDRVLKELGGADEGFTYDWARAVWGSLSGTYAKAAEGPAVVFAQTAHTRSILYNTELPALQANPQVGLDGIHFAYTPPGGWSQEAKEELGADAVRAQLQVDDPTLAHYVDPKTYAQQEPAVRQAAVEASCAAVAAERTPAEPTAKAEAPAPKPAASVPVWQLGFKPVPTALRTGPAGPAVTPPAPPAPALGKESAETGLG
ncbi:hypothetical protein ACVB8X_09105 [Streptomyces sp. NRAIS4]